MITITDLPIEVIHIILQQKIIDIEDVVNFSLTCRRFNDAFDNLLWKIKLYQSFDIRWPYLKKIYGNRIKNNESINFKDEVKANVKCKEALFSYLSLLSEKLFNELEPSDSDIKNFDILFRPNINARTMNYHFLKDELLHQIKMSPLDPKCNLTHQYYSEILLSFLQRRHLEDVWLEFINYPKEQQLLENAVTILAQWYQPEKCIYDFDIEASLDDITQQALNSLKKAHWDHPIFSTSAEQFSFWKYNNIDYNQWSRIEEMQIIDVLRTVLIDELGFHLNRTLYEVLEQLGFNHKLPPNNVFIHYVLESKVGKAVMLAIIFQSVARRLGVRCDLVNGTLGFWLYWKPKSIAENPEDNEYFYIDILRYEAIRHRTNCSMEPYTSYMEVNPTKMASPRIQNNYNDRISLEGSHRTEDILKTFDMSVQCMNLQMSRNPIIPKNRTGNMKYAVGIIVTCIKHYLNPTGVIIGWDVMYNCDVKEKYNCIPVFNNSQTCDTVAQPFYVILGIYGVHYAAQDTLIEARPRWIKNSEIGRYFCRFANNYYVPNEVLTRHYPYDQDFLNNYYSVHCFH